MKDDPESSLVPLSREDMATRRLSMDQEVGPYQTTNLSMP